MKTSIPSVLITFSLVCFGLSPTAKALLPPPAPDGGYPGGNTAEGNNALHDVHTAVGINNTAVGANALTQNTTGAYNVAVGSLALASNTTGDFNMAIGTQALTNNNANFNLAIGYRVLFMNTTGNHLTGIGAAALRNNTTAGFNTAIGADALRENTTGEDNTAIGADALSSNITGSFNTANGVFALLNNTTGSANTATGVRALLSNMTGSDNTANGYSALQGNTAGHDNTATGTSALYYNTTGSANTANGLAALGSNTTGNDNTANGFSALLYNNGSQNTANGFQALYYNTGSNNIGLGFNAGFNLTTGSGNVCIGSGVMGVAGENNTTRIRNVYSSVASGRAVYIDSNNKIGTLASTRRVKNDIKPMDKASEAVLALKPVSFRYKREIDASGTLQFGLIAEEVADINADLVTRDSEGKPETVRYDAVNAMLLNEFLKEHHQVQDLKTIVAEQQKQIEALIAGLQKVSAQLEASKPAPQVVNNP